MRVRKSRIHAVLVTIAIAIAPVVAQAKAPTRDWATPPDFEALRAEYTARVDFQALCDTGRPLTEAFADLQAERWSDLLAVTGPWTERCPVDMEAHALRAAALQRSGRVEEGDAHEMWARGLFEAVLASGDGKAPETAYRVIAEFEEYALLRLFRYRPLRQSPTPNGVDALTVVAEGEERVLYFEAAQRPLGLAVESSGAHAVR